MIRLSSSKAAINLGTVAKKMAGHLTARKVATGKAGGGQSTGIWDPLLRCPLPTQGEGRHSRPGNHARSIDERRREDDVPPFGEVADQMREALSSGFRHEKRKGPVEIDARTDQQFLHSRVPHLGWLYRLPAMSRRCPCAKLIKDTKYIFVLYINDLDEFSGAGNFVLD
jgi:hypothetical protein